MHDLRFDCNEGIWSTRPSRRGVLRALSRGALAGAMLQIRTPASRAETFCDRDDIVFSDGFESGRLSAWDNPQGLEVQQREVFGGEYAVQAAGSGQPRFARTGLGGTYDDLFYRIKFNALSIPENDWVYLMTLRTPSDEPLVGFAIVEDRRLAYRNNVVNDPSIMVPGVQSATRVSLGAWHELQAHIHIDGDESWVEVWLDGLALDDMFRYQPLGHTPMGRIQIGESLSYRSFNVIIDEVAVATSFCGMYLAD